MSNLLNRFRSSFFISGLGVWDSSIRTDKYTKSDPVHFKDDVCKRIFEDLHTTFLSLEKRDQCLSSVFNLCRKLHPRQLTSKEQRSLPKILKNRNLNIGLYDPFSIKC
ncbi:hypothetical protein LBHB_11935 [Leptospira borgpetersenii serovar Hardjo]|nr:hypothetical protein LBHB_11935 [Leptospira borgpetersenii serovar Hardjo]